MLEGIVIGFGIGYFIGHWMGYSKCYKDTVMPLSRILKVALDKLKNKQ